MKLRKKKFISLLSVAMLLSSPVLSQVAYAVEAENREATGQEVKGVQDERQAEETPLVQLPKAEVPVVEEIELPKDQIPIPEPVPTVEEILPPEGVQPIPNPEVIESSQKPVVEAPAPKVSDVTVTINIDIDGETSVETFTGKPGEEFGLAFQGPTTHALWLVDFLGDDYVQMEVTREGELFIIGVFPPTDTTYNAFFTVREVAADVQVNYINLDTNEVIPTAPITSVAGLVGEVIVVDALILTGYELVSDPSQTVTISTTPQEITFYYVESTTPVENSAEVIFLDENWEPVIGAPLIAIAGLVGEEVQFDPPIIPGYIYDGPTILIVPEQGEDVIVIYERIDITLTISHVDTDGAVLIENQTFVNKIGEAGVITPAVIPGYTFVGVKSTTATKVIDTLSRNAPTTIPYTFSGVDETMVFEYSKNGIQDPDPGKPGEPGKPGQPGKPTPPIVEDNFVPISNVKEKPAPKAANDDLPKAGEVENMMATSIGAAMIGLFFAFISRFKKDEYTL